MRHEWTWTATLVLLGSALPVQPPAMAGGDAPRLTADPAPAVACVGDPAAVRRFDFAVDGEPTYGLYAAPRSEPIGLAMVEHGYVQTAYEYIDVLRALAERGLLAVAVNYRGTIERPPLPDPDPRGIPVRAGAEDVIAIARHLDELCAFGSRSLLCHSLGCGIAGFALLQRPERTAGGPLFDQWTGYGPALDAVLGGLAAELLGPVDPYFEGIRQDLHAEMGGSVFERPADYVAISPAWRTDEIARSGVERVEFVHGALDGEAPIETTARTVAGLIANGVPTELVVLAAHPEGAEPGTTIDGLAAAMLGVPYTTPFDGHGSDLSERLAIDRVVAFASGFEPLSCAELVGHDGLSGATAAAGLGACPR